VTALLLGAGAAGFALRPIVVTTVSLVAFVLDHLF